MFRVLIKLFSLFNFFFQLNMPTEQLVSNFKSLLLSVNAMRPKRDGKFITHVRFTSPPSQENLLIDPADFPFDDYVRGATKTEKTKTASAVEEPENEVDEEVALSAQTAKN